MEGTVPLDRENDFLGLDLEVLLVVVVSEVGLGQVQAVALLYREDDARDLDLKVSLGVASFEGVLGQVKGVLALDREENSQHLGQEGSLVFVHREVCLQPGDSLVVVAHEVGLVQEEATLALDRENSLLDPRGEGNEPQLRLY